MPLDQAPIRCDYINPEEKIRVVVVGKPFLIMIGTHGETTAGRLNMAKSQARRPPGPWVLG